MQESHFCVMLGSAFFAATQPESDPAHQEGFLSQRTHILFQWGKPDDKRNENQKAEIRCCCNCICCCFSWKRKDTRLGIWDDYSKWKPFLTEKSINGEFLRPQLAEGHELLYLQSWTIGRCGKKTGYLWSREGCDAFEPPNTSSDTLFLGAFQSLPAWSFSTELLEITGGEWLQVQECKEWTHAQIHK